MSASLPDDRSWFLDWRPWALLLLALAVYQDVVRYEFVNFDDDAHVYENEHVRTGLSLANLRWAFGIHGPSQWHPLAWLSHQLDCQLFGLEPGGHHAVNLAWHALSVVLLYVALKGLLGRPGASLFVAAMFAIHPLNVETVAWISERRNVLCAAFWMGALIAYTGYARHGGWKWYLAVLMTTAGALMGKPMAVTLPCVFLLLDYWPLRRLPLPETLQPASTGTVQPPWRRRSAARIVLEKLPLFAMAAGAGWLSYLCQQSIGVVSSLDALPLRLRIENALASYGLYLRRMVWPVDLAVLYPHPGFTHSDPEAVLRTPALVWGGVLALVSILAVWKARKHPALLVGWLWFLGVLAPMIGFVQVGKQQLADRYAYVAMIGLGLAVAGLVRPRSLLVRRAVIVLATLAVMGWALAAWVQVGYWSDSVTLFTRTVAVTSDNSHARLNLGLGLYREGDVGGAIRQYEEALRIDPEYALAWYNLGVAYHDSGRVAAAVQCFQQAVTRAPNDVNAWLRLGSARGQLGDLAGAIRDFEQALQLAPDSAMAYVNLGLALEELGRLDEAIERYERAVKLAPEDEKARDLLRAARMKRSLVPSAEDSRAGGRGER